MLGDGLRFAPGILRARSEALTSFYRTYATAKNVKVKK